MAIQIQQISERQILVDGNLVYKDKHKIWVSKHFLQPVQEQALVNYLNIREIKVIDPEEL